MTGFEAISHYNGWAQSIAGILIVMCGLSALSFAISQLHKVAALLERRKKPLESEKSALVPAIETVAEPPAHDVEQTIAAYRSLAEGLGEPFQMDDLFRLCREKGFSHPHLSIKLLRDTGALKPVGDGAFAWQA